MKCVYDLRLSAGSGDRKASRNLIYVTRRYRCSPDRRLLARPQTVVVSLLALVLLLLYCCRHHLYCLGHRLSTQNGFPFLSSLRLPSLIHPIIGYLNVTAKMGPRGF